MSKLNFCMNPTVFCQNMVAPEERADGYASCAFVFNGLPELFNDMPGRFSRCTELSIDMPELFTRCTELFNGLPELSTRCTTVQQVKSLVHSPYQSAQMLFSCNSLSVI